MILLPFFMDNDFLYRCCNKKIIYIAKVLFFGLQEFCPNILDSHHLCSIIRSLDLSNSGFSQYWESYGLSSPLRSEICVGYV